jgi:hypothetical protein
MFTAEDGALVARARELVREEAAPPTLLARNLAQLRIAELLAAEFDTDPLSVMPTLGKVFAKRYPN